MREDCLSSQTGLAPPPLLFGLPPVATEGFARVVGVISLVFVCRGCGQLSTRTLWNKSAINVLSRVKTLSRRRHNVLHLAVRGEDTFTFYLEHRHKVKYVSPFLSESLFSRADGPSGASLGPGGGALHGICPRRLLPGAHPGTVDRHLRQGQPGEAGSVPRRAGNASGVAVQRSGNTGGGGGGCCCCRNAEDGGGQAVHPVPRERHRRAAVRALRGTVRVRPAAVDPARLRPRARPRRRQGGHDDIRPDCRRLHPRPRRSCRKRRQRRRSRFFGARRRAAAAGRRGRPVPRRLRVGGGPAGPQRRERGGARHLRGHDVPRLQEADASTIRKIASGRRPPPVLVKIVACMKVFGSASSALVGEIEGDYHVFQHD